MHNMELLDYSTSTVVEEQDPEILAMRLRKLGREGYAPMGSPTLGKDTLGRVKWTVFLAKRFPQTHRTKGQLL